MQNRERVCPIVQKRSEFLTLNTATSCGQIKKKNMKDLRGQQHRKDFEGGGGMKKKGKKKPLTSHWV